MYQALTPTSDLHIFLHFNLTTTQYSWVVITFLYRCSGICPRLYECWRQKLNWGHLTPEPSQSLSYTAKGCKMSHQNICILKMALKIQKQGRSSAKFFGIPLQILAWSLKNWGSFYSSQSPGLDNSRNLSYMSKNVLLY